METVDRLEQEKKRNEAIRKQCNNVFIVMENKE